MMEDLDILPYLENEEREHVRNMREVLDSIEESRGWLAVDTGLSELAECLFDLHIGVVELNDELLATQPLRKAVLGDRILVTGRNANYVLTACEFWCRVIAVEAVQHLSNEEIAGMISKTAVKLGLFDNRSLWILFLKPDGNHEMKRLPR